MRVRTHTRLWDLFLARVLFHDLTVVCSGLQDDKNRWIMISYNWDVQEQAKELCANLQSEGFTVWMDILEGVSGRS